MTNPYRFRLLAAAVLCGLAACPAFAQQAPTAPAAPDILSDRPDKDPTAANDGPIALDEAFESVAAGISFQPPANGKKIRRPGEQEFVRFLYEDEKAYLTAGTYSLQEPAPLTTTGNKLGLLETASQRLRLTNPGAEIVREDITNVRDGNVGLMVARYTVGTASYLSQQAIIQDSERVYYTLTYITPGSKPTQRNAAMPPDGAIISAPPTPAEQRALDTFAAVLDSVRLIDRTNIKLDQDQRLFRTRAFYVNLSQAKIEKELVPEQYFRIVRNGQDTGYVVANESTGKLGGFPSVKIATRTHTFVDDERKRQVYSESWMQMTSDRKHETWTRSSVISESGKKEKQHTSEIGASDLATKAVSNTPAGERLELGERPTFRMVDEYPLTVKFSSTAGAIEPVEVKLPPWYCPQALVYVLPRLVPENDPKGYLFATYVPERREVMLRYIDVLQPRWVSFGGADGQERQEAVPIEDKVGLDGHVTTHYVTPNGTYLGSETKFTDDAAKEITISFIATTAADLKQRWGERANLAPLGDAPGALKPADDKGR